MQRKSKLQPETFFKDFTIGLWGLHKVTFNTFAGKCEELQGQLKPTRQGLFSRIDAGIEILEALLNQAMEYTGKMIYPQKRCRL